MNKKIFITYLAFIVFAETVTMYVDPGYGLLVHVFIPVSLLALFRLKPEENPNLYPILSVAPLIRIITISMHLQVISDILLILLLASKELISTDTRKTLKAIDKALTTVILPLLISFTLNISKILGFL